MTPEEKAIRTELGKLKPEVRKPWRAFDAIKTAAHPKGIAIDFCPFCGTSISAPFKDAASQPPGAATPKGGE